jgi:hypothetical protein
LAILVAMLYAWSLLSAQNYMLLEQSRKCNPWHLQLFVQLFGMCFHCHIFGSYSPIHCCIVCLDSDSISCSVHFALLHLWLLRLVLLKYIRLTWNPICLMEFSACFPWLPYHWQSEQPVAHSSMQLQLPQRLGTL